jgi:hypothetical protein
VAQKGVDAVRESPGLFREDRAMTVRGVGKNMVRSIRHWCLRRQARRILS